MKLSTAITDHVYDVIVADSDGRNDYDYNIRRGHTDSQTETNNITITVIEGASSPQTALGDISPVNFRKLNAPGRAAAWNSSITIAIGHSDRAVIDAVSDTVLGLVRAVAVIAGTRIGWGDVEFDEELQTVDKQQYIELIMTIAVSYHANRDGNALTTATAVAAPSPVTPPPVTPPAALTLTASPAALTLTAGAATVPSLLLTTAAAGGVAPYAYALTGAPPNLTVTADGALRLGSMFTAAQDRTLTITVTDSSSPPVSASADVPLTVSLPALSLTLSESAVSYIAGIESERDVSTATASGGVGAVAYSISGAPENITIAASGVIRLGDTFATIGAHTITVTATDAAGQTATATLQITTTPRPLTLFIAPTTVALVAGTDANRDLATASGVGGFGEKTYYLVGDGIGNVLIDASTGVIRVQNSFQNTETVNITVGVRDGADQTATATLTVTLTAPPLSLSLSQTAVVLDVAAADENQDISAAIAVGGLGALSYSIAGAPANITIGETTGVVRLGAAFADGAIATITVTVTDTAGQTASAVMIVTATVPPLTLSLDPATIDLMAGITHNVNLTTASGAGGIGALTYSLQNPPENILIDSVTGVIRITENPFIPASLTDRTVNITVTVMDENGHRSASEIFIITLTIRSLRGIILNARTSSVEIFDNNIPRTIIDVIDRGGGVGAIGYSLRDAPENITIMPVSVSNPLPRIVIMTAFEEPRVIVFVVIATDSVGQTAEQSFTLTVTAPPLTLTLSSARVTFRAGALSGLVLSSTVAGGNRQYTYSVRAQNGQLDSHIAARISITADGDVRLSSPITVVGEYPLEVVVSDGIGGMTTAPFTLNVLPPLTLSAAFNTQPTAQARVTDNIVIATVIAANGAGGYSYQLRSIPGSGGLPPNITLTADGGLRVGDEFTAAGTYPIRIAVSDSAGGSFLLDDAITVTAPPPPLRITLDNTAFAAIAETTVNSIIATASAAHGVSPYTYALRSAGSTGLVAPAAGRVSIGETSGIIRLGNAFADAETIPLTVVATDAEGDEATTTLTITVRDILTADIAPAEVNLTTGADGLPAVIARVTAAGGVGNYQYAFATAEPSLSLVGAEIRHTAAFPAAVTRSVTVNIFSGNESTTATFRIIVTAAVVVQNEVRTNSWNSIYYLGNSAYGFKSRNNIFIQQTLVMGLNRTDVQVREKSTGNLHNIAITFPRLDVGRRRIVIRMDFNNNAKPSTGIKFSSLTAGAASFTTTPFRERNNSDLSNNRWSSVTTLASDELTEWTSAAAVPFPNGVVISFPANSNYEFVPLVINV